MVAATKTVTVRFTGDTAGLDKASARASKNFDRFKGAALAGAAAAGLALAKFGKDSVGAFAESEAAQAKLADAFARFPKLADTNIGALQKLNTQLARKTKFDDDATAAGQAVLAQYKLTGTQVARLTPLLQDYAAKTGRDLPAAAEVLGKALLGKGRALADVGIKFKDTGSVAGNFDQIMQGLNTQVGGFATKQGKSASGQAAILANQFGELQEQAGQKLLPALLKLADVGLKTVDWISRNQKIVIPLAAGIAALATTIWAINAATKAWAAVQVVLNLALWSSPITWIVAGLALVAVGVVLLATKTKFFQTVWAGTWAFMKTVGAWFAGPFVGFFTGAWNKIVGGAKAVFNWLKSNWPLLLGIIAGPFGLAVGLVIKHWSTIRSALAAAWAFIRDNVFNPLRNFITVTIPNAFKSGVQTVAVWWNRLQGIAAAPVKFVIQTVINEGIIGGINWVASKVGVKSLPRMPLPRGIGDGPGLPRGAGDGIGGLLGVFTNPARWFGDRLAGPLGGIKKRFGDSPFTSMLLGAGNKVKGFALDKLKSLLSIGEAGTALGGAAGRLLGATANLRGLQPGILGVLGSLRAAFGSVPVISGYRPGATTLSGNVSYHASGRAIDIAPVYPWAQFLSVIWGPRLRELITPWNGLNIRNGRPYRYSGAVWNQHNFAGGNAHIHAALAGGGVISEPIFGIGRSGRTYSFGERGQETVIPGTVSPGPEILELHIDLGEGIRQVVQVNLRERDRDLKRRVGAGATR